MKMGKWQGWFKIKYDVAVSKNVDLIFDADYYDSLRFKMFFLKS
jgi:hypothetical protein